MLPYRVLLWHWGRGSAGAKFTYELAQQLPAFLAPKLVISGAYGSDLAALSQSMDVYAAHVSTFDGDKATLSGKLAAVKGVLGLPMLAYQFHRILVEHRIDVAVCTFQSIWDVAALLSLSGDTRRFVLILHDAFFHPGDEYPLRHSVLRKEVHKADAIVVLSNHVQQQVIQSFGFPADRIWKMHHGVFTFGDMRPAEHPAGRRPLRLLFFGRILTYKGLDVLLRAQKLLLQRGVAVELVVAGAGNICPYAQLLKDLGDAVEVHNYWIGEQEIANLFAACDVAVLPYIEASQSGVAAAAYGAGRPVVATPVGGLIEQVIHGTTGLLARDVSSDALADAISDLAHDQLLFEKCATGALDYAKGELSWRNSAECISTVIDTVATAPRQT